MNKHNKKWTSDEDEVIIQNIGSSPGNMRNAFENAARQLRGRSFLAISNHWYTSLSKGKTHLATVSSAGSVMHNRKLTRMSDTKPSLRSEMLKESLMQLNRQQRKDVINFLMDLPTT